MIEKLKWDEQPEDAAKEVQNLIDKIVDAVNGQQQQLNNHECRLLDLQNRITALDDPTYHETEKDPFAEQRRWIGKVCRFWYDNPNDSCLDYLEEIRTGKNGIEYFSRETEDWFPHCEPVKPDDDIIFKGE